MSNQNSCKAYYLYGVCAAAVLSLGTTSARAEEAGSSAAQPAEQGLGEIVVTARKREETLQSVPVAVTAISALQLKNNLASDLSKVAELAPQVSIMQGGSGTGALLTIRGISSANNDAGLDQSVLVDIDDVPLSRGQVIAAATYDLASVQVLQGPQALFFGKNSPAGVISLQSADPTDRFEGYITGGYEFNAHETYSEGAISGPLTDTLKARFAYRVDHIDGWMSDIAPTVQDFINPSITDPGAAGRPHSPAGEDYAGRVSLLWTPTSDFSAKLKVSLDAQDRDSGNGNSEPFCTGGQTTPLLLASIPIPNGDCEKNQVRSVGNAAPEYAANFPNANGGVPYFRSRFALASLTLKKDFEDVSVTSTTGYYTQKVTALAVSDWSPYASIWSTSKERYSLITEELRANTNFDGPLNIMGGIYYEHFSRPYTNSADLFHAFNPISQNYAAVSINSKTTGDYLSLFAQARWMILPKLELAGGARWSHDQKTADLDNYPDNATGPVPSPSGNVIHSHFSDDHVSPEVTLSWHPTRAQTLYVAYKTGYKGGGISTPFILGSTATAQNLQFQPEKTNGFEGGYKATFFNNTLRFDIVGYRYDYDDLQVVSYNAETINFILQNAASARIMGVQGSFEWLAARGLTLSGNFGYNDAKYRNFADAPCYTLQTEAQGCINGAQDLSDKALLRAPKFTFKLGADYDMSVGRDWDAKFSVSATHSSSYQTATDYSPGGVQDAYWLLDAAVHVGPQDRRYEFAVIGRNLTNSYYLLSTVGWSGSLVQNQYVGFFNRPREVAVQATFHW
jgi:outer membrane receptor protein involved in Fe transport